MATATLERIDMENEALRFPSSAPLWLGWALMLPFVFFAAHGAFSFQSGGISAGGSLPGAEVRNPGFLGYVVIPGIAYSIVVWLIKSNLSRVLSYAMHFKMLTLLALLTVCSAAWSQNPSRSALFGALYLVCTLFAYCLVIRFQTAEIMTLVIRAGVVVCLLCLVMAVFFPRFGVIHDDLRVDGAWNGIFIDRTSAAKCLVFLLSPALVSWNKRLSSRIIYILLLTMMIFQAHAVTANVMVFIYVGFIVSLRISRKLDPRLLSAVFMCGLIALALIAFVSHEYGPVILQAFGRDSTLSGRTEIWGAVMESIFKRPLLGYGYYAFWQGLTGESGTVINATNWIFGYAHNGILEIALQLGLVGVVVFFATLVRAIKDAWFCFRNDRSGRYDWYIGLIVLTILYNVDEETVAWPNELLSILYIVACCGLARAVTKLRQERRERHLEAPCI